MAEWQALGDRGLGAVLSIRDAALLAGQTHFAARQDAAARVLVIDGIIVLGVIAIAALTLMRLWQRLLRPVGGIATALGEIGRGETNPPLPRVWREDDETGVIVAGVRNIGALMEERARQEAAEQATSARQAERVARLDALIAAFEADAGRTLDSVASAAQALDGTAAILADAAKEGAGLTDAVAGAADTTAANTQIAAAAAEELAASVAEIARQVTQATDISRRAVAEAGRTDTTMQGLSAAAARIGEFIRSVRAA